MKVEINLWLDFEVFAAHGKEHVENRENLLVINLGAKMVMKCHLEVWLSLDL